MMRTAFPNTAVDEYVRDCFARESPPRVSELAERLGMARSTLHDIFTARYGVSPSAYLKRRQIDHAAHLLRSTALTSAAIAYRSGFGTRRTMFRAFRRSLQCAPNAIRTGRNVSSSAEGMSVKRS